MPGAGRARSDAQPCLGGDVLARDKSAQPGWGRGAQPESIAHVASTLERVWLSPNVANSSSSAARESTGSGARALLFDHTTASSSVARAKIDREVLPSYLAARAME